MGINLKPIFKGIIDAIPVLGSVNKAITEFKDTKKPNANISYLCTFFLTLIIIILFVTNKISYDEAEDLIKLID